MPASQITILLLFLLLALCVLGIIFLYRRNQRLQGTLDQERHAATELKVQLGRQETRLQEEKKTASGKVAGA